MSPEDVLLHEYATTRDANAFSKIVRAYSAMVYGTCLRVTGNPSDAEEASQDCFLALARNAARIQVSLVGWLHTTARNAALAKTKRTLRRQKAEAAATETESPFIEPAWNSLEPYIDAAIAELPDELRIPIILHYLKDKPQTEVATELGISQSAVSRRLSRGVSELRRALVKAGITVSIAALTTLMMSNVASTTPSAAMIASLGKMAVAGVGSIAPPSVTTTIGAAGGTATTGTAVATIGGIGAVKLTLITLAAAAAIITASVVTQGGGQKPAKPSPTPPAIVEKNLAKEPTETIEMVTYKGIILDPNGRPAQGVRVRSDIPNTNASKWIVAEDSTITNEEGRFSLGPLPSAKQLGQDRELIFQHPDYAIAWFKHRKDHFPGSPDLTNITVRLAKSAPVTGTVRDTAGNPVAGAIIEAWLQYEDWDHGYYYMGLRSANGFAVQTDAAGHFRLESAPENSRLHLRVSCPQFSTWTTRDISIRGGDYPVQAGNQNIDITLNPACIVKGRILLNGAPLREEGILIQQQCPLPECTLTNAEGEFIFTGLDEGKYAIYLRNEDMKRLGITGLPVQLNVRLADSPITVDLPFVTGTVIQGQLLSEKDSQPVENQTVGAIFQSNNEKSIVVDSAPTDATGYFSLRLPDGSFELKTAEWVDGKIQLGKKDIDVTDRSQNEVLVWKISTRPKIMGCLIDTHGNPIKGHVRLGQNSSWIDSDENGEFSFLEPEDFRPHPLDPDPRVYAGLAISDDTQLGCSFSWQPEDNRLNLTLQPVSSVIGRVVNQNDQAIEDARIRIYALSDGDLIEGGPPCQIFREQGGRFRIHPMPPGLKWHLSISAPDRSGYPEVNSQRRIETIEPGKITDVGTAILQMPDNETLPWDATLSGRVTDENGAPVVGAHVLALPRAYSLDTRTVYTDIEGTFHLENLPRDQTVTITVGWPNNHSRRFENVHAGQENLELKIDLKKADGFW